MNSHFVKWYRKLDEYNYFGPYFTFVGVKGGKFSDPVPKYSIYSSNERVTFYSPVPCDPNKLSMDCKDVYEHCWDNNNFTRWQCSWIGKCISCSYNYHTVRLLWMKLEYVYLQSNQVQKKSFYHRKQFIINFSCCNSLFPSSSDQCRNDADKIFLWMCGSDADS